MLTEEKTTTNNTSTADDDDEYQTPFGKGRWKRKKSDLKSLFSSMKRGREIPISYKNLTSPSQRRVGLKPHDFGESISDTQPTYGMWKVKKKKKSGKQ